MFPKRGRPPLYSTESERRAAVKKLSKKRNTTRVYLLEAFDLWSKTKDLSPFKKATNAVFASHIIEIHNAHCSHCNVVIPFKSGSSDKLELSESSAGENSSSSMSNDVQGNEETESNFEGDMELSRPKGVNAEQQCNTNESMPSTSRYTHGKRRLRLNPKSEDDKCSSDRLEQNELETQAHSDELHEGDSLDDDSESVTSLSNDNDKKYGDSKGQRESSDDQLLSDSSLPPKKKKKWLITKGSFTCVDCGYTFTHKEHLQSHIQRLHAEKMFLCSYEDCNQTFVLKSDLEKHETCEHLNIKPEKMLPCSFKDCTLKFSSKKNVKKHELTHTGEKPYLCIECGRTFRYSDNLKVHERQHTGEKPIQCSQCEFTCRQKASLNYHLQKHHLGLESTLKSSIELNSEPTKSKELMVEPDPLPELNMHEVFEKSLTYYLDHNGT